MPLPKPFQHQPSAIASYDFTDIVEGTGIKKFFGFISNVSSGDTPALISQAVYSSKIETQVTITAGSSKEIDLDFDLAAFNAPSSIRGTITVSVPFEINRGGAGASNDGFVVVRFRKWDGTTETELASVQSETLTADDATTTITKMLSMIMPITGIKHFKKGETLRMTVEVWGNWDSGGTAGDMIIAHDPLDRDGAEITPSTEEITTKMEFFIPFDIDV